MNAGDLINLAGAYQINASTAVLTPATAKQLLQPNPKRWCLLIGFQTAGSSTVWIDSTLTATKGFQITATIQIFQSGIKDHASLTQGEWWGFSTAGTTVSIIEVVIP